MDYKKFFNQFKIDLQSFKKFMIVVFGIILGLSTAYGFGTFHPNRYVLNNIAQAHEQKSINEWTAFGFTEPSIEYNNNTEFVQGVQKCVMYHNLGLTVDKRIPMEIITSMAVLETGWGQSRFAKKANNLFGIRTWDPNVPQLKPLDLPDADFGVKRYITKCASVKDMIDILNRHPAYEAYRIERANQLAENAINIDRQIELLNKWSTNPDYTKLVKAKVKTIVNLLKKEG